MKDNKEIRALNSEEGKDISGGMNVDSKNFIDIIKPAMVAYGGPNIRPNLMKYGGPAIKINTEPKCTVEELIPNNSENSKK